MRGKRLNWDIFEDERILFVAAFSLVAFHLLVSPSLLANPLFLALVGLWAVIIIRGMRLKRHILRAEGLTAAMKAGTLTRNAAVRFYVLAFALLGSTLVPVLLSFVYGLESIFFAGLIGALVGLDFDIAYGWLKRDRKQ